MATLEEPRQENMSAKVFIDWNTIRLLSYDLAEKVRHLEPKTIVAIARGGLIPATLIARQLDIRRMFVLNLTHYEEENQREQLLEIESLLPHFNWNDRVLLIDDINDTGLTLSKATEKVKTAGSQRISAVVLFEKPHTIYTPTYFGRQVRDTDWVVFPWENC